MSLIQRSRLLVHVGNLLCDADTGRRHRTFGTVYVPNANIPVKTIEQDSPDYHADVVALHDDDPPSDTDYTSEAASPDTNDVPCMPATGAVADGLYIGDAAKFNTIRARIDTVGVGTYTYTLKYWNGSTWTAVPAFIITGNVIDQFKTSNWCWTMFTTPVDWALYTLMSQNLYWVKFELTSFTSCTTVPKVGQIWIGELWV